MHSVLKKEQLYVKFSLSFPQKVWKDLARGVAVKKFKLLNLPWLGMYLRETYACERDCVGHNQALCGDSDTPPPKTCTPDQPAVFLFIYLIIDGRGAIACLLVVHAYTPAVCLCVCVCVCARVFVLFLF